MKWNQGFQFPLINLRNFDGKISNFSGESLAVLTPDEKVTSCEVASDGQTIVIALEGRQDLVTCLLCNKTGVNDKPQPQPYGNPDNTGKVFDLTNASR